MTRKALMVSAALVGLLAAAPAMAKGSLYTLPLVSGSSETIAFGVDDDLNVTGFWLDSNSIEEGFIGPADGTDYTTFLDDPTYGTQPRGLNAKGYVTGIDGVGTDDPTTYVPFERSPGGTVTDVTMDGNPLNYLVRGINDAGDLVGWYIDTDGVEHGFLLSGKTATTIDDPNGTTNLEGINNNGEISGLYTDADGNRHGITYDIKKQKFTELTVPGSTYVEVWGLNDNGVVAIDGENSDGTFTGYLYCPKASVCPSGAALRSPHLPSQHQAHRLVPTAP